MDYQEVSKYSSSLFVSHECGVGFGNSIFSSSYLSQLLTLFATGQPQDFERMIRFVSQVFLFSVFTKERIVSIAKNLLSSLVDIKRDGNGVLSAVVDRVSMSTKFANRIGSNELAISIFKQEQFLKDVITQCKDGKEENVIHSLNLLRQTLAKDSANYPSFIRLGVPNEFSFLRNGQVSTCSEIAKKCYSFWNSEFIKFSKKIDGSDKRKSKFNDDHSKKVTTFPFPRIAFSFDQMEKEFSSSILVPVAGLSTSYLSQIVPCDLIKAPKHEDYFPALLLAELISKAEGPLYTGIRGQG
jgi:Zn-dependent M16 (insulinase) family peptidase